MILAAVTMTCKPVMGVLEPTVLPELMTTSPPAVMSRDIAPVGNANVPGGSNLARHRALDIDGDDPMAALIVPVKSPQPRTVPGYDPPSGSEM